MQEKNREISILKKNILQYLDYKGIKKSDFYTLTGASNGVLSQNNGLSEDNLLRFLNYFTDINPDWLLTGQGSMLRNAVATDATHSIDMQCNMCKQKEKRIEELHYIIDIQRELIQELKEKGEEWQPGAGNASVADVG